MAKPTSKASAASNPSKLTAASPKPAIGLGRGLADIIKQGAQQPQPAAAPTASPTQIPPGATVRQLALSMIITNPRQPRVRFQEEPLEELMASIKEHGVLQPITVRPKDQHFEIIAGERRFRACQKAGLTSIPALVKMVSDVEAYELALIENLQRENLDPMEEARGYKRLATDFSLTQELIAQKVGKNRATVANVMRLLDLPEEVQGYLSQGRLSPGHAKVILGLQDSDLQIRTAQDVIRKGLNVRDTEGWVNRLKGGSAPRSSSKSAGSSGASKEIPPHLKAIQEALQQKLATRVNIHPSGNGGKIEVSYYTPGDLDRLLEMLQIQL
jgi:ParB family transcriptional regulator, chromosome partitioning protein